MKKGKMVLTLVSILFLASLSGCLGGIMPHGDAEIGSYVFFPVDNKALRFELQENNKVLVEGVDSSGEKLGGATTENRTFEYQKQNGSYVWGYSTLNNQINHSFIFNSGKIIHRWDIENWDKGETEHIVQNTSNCRYEIYVFVVNGTGNASLTKIDKRFKGELGNGSETKQIEGEAPKVYSFNSDDKIDLKLEKNSKEKEKLIAIAYDTKNQKVLAKKENSAPQGTIHLSKKLK